MSDSDSTSSSPDAVEATAAQWLARRDRGLSAPEQAAYAQWASEDPRRAAAVLRLERVWRALDRLAQRNGLEQVPPDPDLLAPRGGWTRWAWAPLLAAAAVVAVVYFSNPSQTQPARPDEPRAIVHPGPERLTLEDGSVVELNGAAKVEVQFTPGERRVRLVRGEVFFSVAKNPRRPFIVRANQVTVSAVGTAFSVGLEQREISVLVTEGKVRVDEVLPVAGHKAVEPRELSALVAGEQGLVTLSDAPDNTGRSEIKVSELNPDQIDRAMAWQGQRLEFVTMPLSAVVAEFNRHNRKKLVVHDAETGAILVGGNFRADNVDAFTRLLGAGFGVSAFPHGEEIILRKTRRP